MSAPKLKFWGIFMALIAGFLIPITAYAVHVSIDTNDGTLDSNWSSVNLFATDGDDYSDDNYDLNQVWLTNEADDSFFYFRANLIGSGQLPSSDNWSSIEAHLDCNQNDNDFDHEDIIVAYYGQNNLSIECHGDKWPDCGPGEGSADWNDMSTAEEISGTPNNYEWMADVNNGNVDWSPCLGTVNVRFVTLIPSEPKGVVGDSTDVREYNIPTSVTLDNFTAGKPDGRSMILVILVPLGITSFIMLSWKMKWFCQDS